MNKKEITIIGFLFLVVAGCGFVSGCTVDTRTNPAIVIVEQDQALQMWDALMIRRAQLFKEMSDPEIDPVRKEEIQDIITTENDLFNLLMNYFKYSGSQFKFELNKEESPIGANVDSVQVPR